MNSSLSSTPHDLTLNELSRVYRQVYRTLISYDERGKLFVPELATSWKQIDPGTIEFQLRDDVTFHSGIRSPRTTSSIPSTISSARSPRSRQGEIRISQGRRGRSALYRSHQNRTGPGTALSSIAYELFILDLKIHSALADKTTYGRVSASSAGQYKVVSMDPRRARCWNGSITSGRP